MRILAVETSSPRGTVALLDSTSEDALCLEHRVPNAHGEMLVPLLEQALAELGWAPSQLDRVAVGSGPGSFTGLRVGIALATGIAMGLGRPLVGVSSLQAMAAAARPNSGEVVVALLDARREELFGAAFDSNLTPCSEVCALKTHALGPWLEHLELPQPVVVVGEAVELSDVRSLTRRGPETDLPHALWTARVGCQAEPQHAVEPAYVRPADAIVPNLPPSPLNLPRS